MDSIKDIDICTDAYSGWKAGADGKNWQPTLGRPVVLSDEDDCRRSSAKERDMKEKESAQGKVFKVYPGRKTKEKKSGLKRYQLDNSRPTGGQRKRSLNLLAPKPASYGNPKSLESVAKSEGYVPNDVPDIEPLPGMYNQEAVLGYPTAAPPRVSFNEPPNAPAQPPQCASPRVLQLNKMHQTKPTIHRQRRFGDHAMPLLFLVLLFVLYLAVGSFESFE